MIISIKNNPYKIEKAVVRKAVKFFSNSLLSTRLNKSLYVKIIFTKGFNKTTKCIATCTWVDSNVRPKKFEIEVDADLSVNQTIRALAHEMVHLKQYATGQMKDFYSNDSTKWEGKIHENVSNLNDDYWIFPWEIEAYGREVGLFVLFNRYLKEEKILKRQRSIL
jgi:hypothetical protein